MTGYIVYVDQVFLGNLFMNYLILWSAGRLSNARSSLSRLILASAVGSIYSLAIFLPGTGQLFSPLAKLLFSLLMLAIAFVLQSWRTFLLSFFFFYLASFALGGMVFGFSYFLQNSTVAWHEPGGMLSVISRHFWAVIWLTLIFAWIACRLGARLLQRRATQQLFPITINFFGLRVEVEALVDTGNRLADPLSGDPVIIVEYEALKSALPQEIFSSFEEEEFRCEQFLMSVADTPWAKRIRVIPFHSLGEQNGLLIGIRPDGVEIKQGAKKISTEKVVVGICRHRLQRGSNYQALLHPILLEAA